MALLFCEKRKKLEILKRFCSASVSAAAAAAYLIDWLWISQLKNLENVVKRWYFKSLSLSLSLTLSLSLSSTLNQTYSLPLSPVHRIAVAFTLAQCKLAWRVSFTYFHKYTRIHVYTHTHTHTHSYSLCLRAHPYTHVFIFLVLTRTHSHTHARSRPQANSFNPETLFELFLKFSLFRSLLLISLSFFLSLSLFLFVSFTFFLSPTLSLAPMLSKSDSNSLSHKSLSSFFLFILFPQNIMQMFLFLLLSSLSLQSYSQSHIKAILSSFSHIFFVLLFSLWIPLLTRSGYHLEQSLHHTPQIE